MKKEYQYLVLGAVISAAVLLGMGVVGDEKQVTEGRYQFVPGTQYWGSGNIASLYPLTLDTVVHRSMFLVVDSQTGTTNYVDQTGEVISIPFAATKAE
jgi:hypothetical protein